MISNHVYQMIENNIHDLSLLLYCVQMGSERKITAFHQSSQYLLNISLKKEAKYRYYGFKLYYRVQRLLPLTVVEEANGRRHWLKKVAFITILRCHQPT